MHALSLVFACFYWLPVQGQTDSPVAAGNVGSYRILETRLPKAVSDMTATLLGDAVYIAGGCDSVNGNVYNSGIDAFLCDSISDKLYRYDYRSDSFTELPNLPSPRYRHAAVGVGNSLWLLGGRDVEDNIVTTVDVYNVDTLSWTTFTDLPLEYQVSDNAGFSRGTEAFFAGGYSYVYDFYSTVFSIDTEASLGTASLVLSRKADMLATHGDISATTFNDTHAVITGGYGSTLTFCAAEGDVEMYDFATETWSSLPSLVEARGNAVLAEVDGRLLIFGGERPPENICSVESIEPGDRTIAINEVEVLNVDNDTAGWTVLADFPAHRFRAAGVAIKELSQVIIFGGQDAYSNDCQCYRTSDQIVVYEEERPSSSVPSAVPTSVPVPATSTPLTAPPTGAPTSVPRDDSPSSEHSSQPPVLLPSVKPSLLPLTSSLSPSLGSTSRSPSTPAPSTSSGQQTPMVTFTCITVVALLLHCSEHIM